jgi:hypothetical protein
VLDGLRTPAGHLGQVDHLPDLGVVVDVEEVQATTMFDLLAVTAPAPEFVVGRRLDEPRRRLLNEYQGDFEDQAFASIFPRDQIVGGEHL